MNFQRLAVLSLLSSMAIATGALAADQIRVCGLRFTSSAANFIALDKGFYADEGLNVSMAYFDAAQPIAVAVSAGSCDIGITGFTAGMYNLAGQDTLRVIAGEAWEEPGYKFIGYVASNTAYKMGLKTIKNLPGKRFGITQLGSTFQYNVGMLAEKYGWRDHAVTIVPLQTVSNMIASIKSGAIDATALPSFVAIPLNAAGAAKLIGWVSDETLWQVSGVIASKKLIDTKRDVVARFIKAYQRATAVYDAAFNHLDSQKNHVFGSDAEALFPIVEKYAKVSRQQVMQGLPYVNKDAKFNAGNIAKQLEWYKAQGFVDKGVTVDKVIDRTFVPVIEKNFK